jgi:hypothetical protein
MKNMDTGIQTIGMRYHGVTVMYSRFEVLVAVLLKIEVF